MDLFQSLNKRTRVLPALLLFIILCIGITGCRKNEEKGEISTNGTSSAAGSQDGSGDGESIYDKYVYVTNDKSVGLGKYRGLTYRVCETEITDEDVDRAMQDVLEYFQEFMEIEELTDEIVSEFYDGVETIDEFRSAVEEILIEESLEVTQNTYENEILTELVQNSDIFVDFTEQASQSYSALIAHYNAIAVTENMTLEQYATEILEMDSEDWQEDIAKEATILTRRHLVLLAVAEAENIVISDSEYEERIEEYMQYYGYDNRELFEKEFTKEYIIQNMIEDSALEFVMEYAMPVSNN